VSKHQFAFWVDGKQFCHDVHTICGAQIRAMVAGLDPEYRLWMEGTGNDPDQQLDHMTAVSIESQRTRFYSVPPTMGG
jgi:hypothetical protein